MVCSRGCRCGVRVRALVAGFGLQSRGEAAIQAAPANVSAPTVSGQPVVGELLTANRGTWTGTEPIQYTYRWQRCDQSGGACSDISVGMQQIYTVSSADLRATLRVQVTATNAEGATSAVSAPTGPVEQAEANVTGCPPVQEAGPLSLDQIEPPARLLIDRKTVTPRVITRSTQRITLRFHVMACDGRSVRGALVYATPVPYQQFARGRAADGLGRMGNADDVPSSRLPGYRPAAAARCLCACSKGGGGSTRRNLD